MAASATSAAVDLTLVDATLEMTPEERLEHNDRMVTMAEELRTGIASADGSDDDG